MGHQPFESWLLSGETLPPEQEQHLQEHLNSCQTCQQLSSAWPEVDKLLQGASLKEPAPGFTARWQSRLAALENVELLTRQRRNTWLFFAVSAGAALLVIIYMIVQYFTSVQAPVQFFISGLTLWAGFLTLVSAAEVAFPPFVELLLVSIPIHWWLIFSALVGIAVLFSTISIRYILLPRRASI
jgi:predicted anti-sigma-YlaC factor YlaD